MQKKGELEYLPCEDEKRPSSVGSTLELLLRWHLGHFWETGWSAYGLFQAYRYIPNWTEPNWTERHCPKTAYPWDRSILTAQSPTASDVHSAFLLRRRKSVGEYRQTTTDCQKATVRRRTPTEGFLVVSSDIKEWLFKQWNKPSTRERLLALICVTKERLLNWFLTPKIYPQAAQNRICFTRPVNAKSVCSSDQRSTSYGSICPLSSYLLVEWRIEIASKKDWQHCSRKRARAHVNKL